MTLRVRTSIESESIVFSVSGRIQRIQVLDLKAMLESQSSNVVLDVRDVRLIDRETVLFCKSRGERYPTAKLPAIHAPVD